MTDPIKILYLDDYDFDRQLVRDALEHEDNRFQVIEARARPEFEAKLDGGEYDLILSDFNILGYDGLQVLAAVQAKDPELPVIIVTGTGSEEVAVEAMKRGAADYIIKTPEHIERLPRTIINVLERKQLRQEQQQSERQLRFQAQILQNIRDAVQVTDLEGQIIYWNKGAEAVFGYTAAEMVGHTPARLYPDQAPAQLAADLQKILAGQTYHREWSGRHKDGATIWVDTTATVMRNQAGEVTGVINTSKDITDRKQLETELRASDERYVRAAKAGSVGVWEWNLDTDEIYIDPHLKKILGFEDHEIENHLDDWGRRVHPDDATEVMAAAQAHIEGQTPLYEVEHRMLHKDGSIHWFLARGLVSRDAAGHADRMVGTDTDITDRREAEQKLRKSQAQLELAIQTAKLGLWDWNLKNDTVYYSPEWKRQLGYGERELSKDFDEIESRLHPDDRERMLAHLHRYLDTPWPDFQTEVRLRHRDGSYRWMLVRATLLIGSFGQPYRLLGSQIDITGRKQSEEELKRRNQFIETILDNLPIGLAVNYIDEGAATYMNSRFEEIYGWPRHQLTNIENFFKAVYPDPDYRAQIQAQIQADIASGQPERMRWDGVEITTQAGHKKIVAAKNIPLLEQNLMVLW